MFGLKIFVRVQTFRRVPPVLPRNFCHPGYISYNFQSRRHIMTLGGVYWSTSTCLLMILGDLSPCTRNFSSAIKLLLGHRKRTGIAHNSSPEEEHKWKLIAGHLINCAWENTEISVIFVIQAEIPVISWHFLSFAEKKRLANKKYLTAWEKDKERHEMRHVRLNR